MYQPSKTEMQRYIDEMMRYHNQWTKTVNDAAQRSREQSHNRDNDAVMAATQETNNAQIDNANTTPQQPIDQSPRPDIPFYPTPQPPLGFSEATVPQQRLEQQEQSERQEQSLPMPQPIEQNRPEQMPQQGEQNQTAPQQNMTESDGRVEITADENGPVDLNEVFKNYQQVFPNIGYIMVQTLTARRAFPVANAIVEISKDFIQGRYVISRQITDMSGQIEKVEVPAVSKDFANSPGNNHPYTTYTIVVKHPEYATLTFKDVPVFEGIMSWQTVDMVPLSVANGSDEQTEFEEDRAYTL